MLHLHFLIFIEGKEAGVGWQQQPQEPACGEKHLPSTEQWKGQEGPWQNLAAFPSKSNALPCSNYTKSLTLYVFNVTFSAGK